MATNSDIVQMKHDMMTLHSTDDESTLNSHQHYDDSDYKMSDDEENMITDAALTESTFYHGKIDRQKAEHQLNSCEKTRCFLVRQSDAHPGIYCISYKNQLGIKHFRISQLYGDYYIGSHQFTSLAAVVHYYTYHQDILMGERLHHPVSPPEPVQTLYNRVIAVRNNIKEEDTDELSFVVGDVFTVKSIIDRDWIWAKLHRTMESGLVPVAFTTKMDLSCDIHEGKIWYFGEPPQSSSTDLLKEEGKVGHYLIKQSDTSPGDYSLVLKTDKGIKKFRIKKDGLRYNMGGRCYDSIDEIIQRYSKEYIVEGLKLGDPLPKKMKEDDFRNNSYKKQDKPESHTIKTQSILKDGKSGKLDIKRKGGKKWRTYHCLLIQKEQRLYYYESDKRAKPKGIIDISHSTVYPLHDGLIGRHGYHFQLISKFLNETTITYLSTDTEKNATQWMTAIIQCSQNSNKNRLRQLEIQVSNAQKLSKTISHPYCIICIDDFKCAQTATKETCNPIWDEEFRFNDLNVDIDHISVKIFNRNRLSKDTLIGLVEVPVAKLPPVKPIDEWFNLTLSDNQIKDEIGSLRLRLKYTNEPLLEKKSCRSLLKVLTQTNTSIIEALVNVCQERISLTGAIAMIFAHERQEINFLAKLIENEIAKADNSRTIFRGTSLVTTIMEHYMKIIAQEHLKEVLTETILKIIDLKHVLEVNSATSSSKDFNLTTNIQLFLSLLNEIKEKIFNFVDTCPNCFMFLRLYCPAILNPRSFNIVSDPLTHAATRNLMTFAKCLQSLANVAGGGKEGSHFPELSSFFMVNKGKTMKFLSDLTAINDYPSNRETITCNIDTEIAIFYHLSKYYIEDLKKKVDSELQDEVTDFIEVFQNLEMKHEESC
ncbi:Ras GTPase-activating protein 1 [Trichoplax sp. H2]|nr:Ras GTPase-activating protein 1 [Trichoplax sp. H2]|eukprot:RDD43752.1 Ras GTPase-activating protein 1 [Trichoplax sp. H2]